MLRSAADAEVHSETQNYELLPLIRMRMIHLRFLMTVIKKRTVRVHVYSNELMFLGLKPETVHLFTRKFSYSL